MTEHAHEARKQTNIPQSQKHPDNYHNDLNPEMMAGQNVAHVGPQWEKNAPTAQDFKEFHEMFPDFTNDELRQIVIMPIGSRLEQGATYVDLKSDDCQPFSATSDMVTHERNWFVPKSEMDYEMWNRLIGIRDPQRTGVGQESGSDH